MPFKTQEQHIADLQRDAALGRAIRELVEGGGSTRPRRATRKKREVVRAKVKRTPVRVQQSRPTSVPNGKPAKRRALSLEEVEELQGEELDQEENVNV